MRRREAVRGSQSWTPHPPLGETRRLRSCTPALEVAATQAKPLILRAFRVGGESSAAGGFPDPGDWRTRRDESLYSQATALSHFTDSLCMWRAISLSPGLRARYELPLEGFGVPHAYLIPLFLGVDEVKKD